MKHKRTLTFVILAILLTTLGVGLASAGAYDTSFTTSITYMNVGDAATTQLKVLFYENAIDTTPIEVTLTNLNKNAGSSVFIGGLSEVTAGFEGSAIMQSDQPMLATLVQLPQGSTTVKVRPLSNGFGNGGPTALVATILKNTFNSNSILSVQNTDSVVNDITVRFYNTSATLVHTVVKADVASGAGFYIDSGTEAGLGTSFNGSAVIDAVRNDSSDGNVIASVMELDITTIGGKAFESVSSGGITFYMPTALCNAFSGNSTAYAIQNTSLSDSTNVEVEYSNGLKETKNIPAGSKASFLTCDVVASGFSGAATLTSDNTSVIAIGKAFGGGLSTAFLGAASGYEKLGLPYVRWTANANYITGSQQRTSIAIQNIGGSPVGPVTVQYIDSTGNVDGTHTITSIGAGEKANSNASSAGLTEFGNPNSNVPPGFGGSVVITGPSGSQLVAVARVSTCTVNNGTTCTTFAAEDYNGLPVTTQP
jgi:hypothetical protein